ncbi:hypothetical protein [Methylobacterium symbioticum]|uniref:Uncharacterized protein n=1 Tax=Methylobacterium symbioticum TaxID=2584084 RepID=A0A509ECL9_9HYPH|nr:hypothetical protein [Methylobacterium symbioticum]VUD71209.1 hypothetical protein MET9862_01786 [Methylobacterium symbioticum]
MQACLDRTEAKAGRALALSVEGLAAAHGGPAPISPATASRAGRPASTASTPCSPGAA